jgi:hypothetical protein
MRIRFEISKSHGACTYRGRYRDCQRFFHATLPALVSIYVREYREVVINKISRENLWISQIIFWGRAFGSALNIRNGRGEFSSWLEPPFGFDNCELHLLRVIEICKTKNRSPWSRAIFKAVIYFPRISDFVPRTRRCANFQLYASLSRSQKWIWWVDRFWESFSWAWDPRTEEPRLKLYRFNPRFPMRSTRNVLDAAHRGAKEGR